MKILTHTPPIVVVLLWTLTLWIFSVRIKYADGTLLRLEGWPERIGRWYERSRKGPSE